MLVIKNNLMAENAAGMVARTYEKLAESVERLSSGLRINSARDDAAGLAVREFLRADIAVAKQARRNLSDAVSMLQTMDGALSNISELLTRMQQLAEQANTETYSSQQRSIMDGEFVQLREEIIRISDKTEFNDIKMLNSATGSVNIHFGQTMAGENSSIDVDMIDATSAQTALQSTSSYGVDSPEDVFVTFAEPEGGTNGIRIKFADTGPGSDEDTINVTVNTSAAGVSYTLNEFVDLINDAAGYDAAAAVYDDGKYRLQIRSQSRLMDAYTMDLTDFDAQPFGSSVSGAFNVGMMGIIQNLRPFMQAESLELIDTIRYLRVNTVGEANNAMRVLKRFIKIHSDDRAYYGSMMNRIESSRNVVDINRENITQSESRISDIDTASETARLTRNNVLANAGIAMLSQANAMPDMAIQLLR